MSSDKQVMLERRMVNTDCLAITKTTLRKLNVSKSPPQTTASTFSKLRLELSIHRWYVESVFTGWPGGNGAVLVIP